jgi:hypothetical protein
MDSCSALAIYKIIVNVGTTPYRYLGSDHVSVLTVFMNWTF